MAIVFRDSGAMNQALAQAGQSFGFGAGLPA